MRRQFKEELKKLKANVLEIFDDVIEQFNSTLELIKKHDSELAERILKRDDLIDSKVLKLEEEGIELVATQFPVARDLRFIHSILIINIHLERIGDLVYNTVKALQRMEKAGQPDEVARESLVKMGYGVLSIIERARNAFEQNNLELVYSLPELDESVDEMFKGILKRIRDFSLEDHTLDWYLSLVLIARYFERAADQAVDIGERVAFILTGKLAELD
jgi:phosphate transport system protein